MLTKNELDLAKEFGSTLRTRELGKKARKKLNGSFETQGITVIDLSGVNKITSSFADEAFGKFFAELDKKEIRESIQFEALSEQQKSLIKMVTARRRK